MKRVWPLLALGIGAFVVFALFTLPAGVVLSRLASAGVVTAGVSGTAWKGEAQVLQIDGVQVGSVQWNLHLLALLAARLSADVKVTRVDGFAQATVSAGSGGRVEFKELTASLPLGSLPSNVVPGGWTGTANLKLAQLALENGWPVSATGTVEGIDITGPANKPVNRGSYKITFPVEGAPADTLTGALSDLGGPLQVAGTVQLKTDRSYLIEGLIATRPDAPRDVVNALQFLDEPDAQGRRPFSVSGTM